MLKATQTFDGRLFVRGIIAALPLLLSISGCGQDPAGLVLVFPSMQAEMDAKSGIIQALTPTAGDCTRLVSYPPPTPDAATIVYTSPSFTLTDGKSSGSLSGLPTGHYSLLVNIDNASSNLFLHGCTTASVESGDSIKVTLVEAVAPSVDLEVTGDGAPQDMTTAPPDMAQHKTLAITVTELRAAGRKLSGVSVSIIDSTGASPAPVVTDANGLAKLDTVSLTPPFQITANAPASGGFQGGVTLSGVTPTFTSDSIAMTIPVELDPPATAAANVINVSVGDGAGKSIDAFWQYVGGVTGDPLQSMALTGSPPAAMLGPLATGAGYRVVLVDNTDFKAATQAGLTNTGNSFTPMIATNFQPYDQTFALTVTKSGFAGYSAQNYAVLLVVAAPPTEAAIPVIPPTTIVAAMAEPGVKVPLHPNMVQPTAQLVAEMVATGPLVRGELRMQIDQPTPSAKPFTDTLPNPPVVTLTPSPSPSPLPAASPFTISATLPTSFPVGPTFVHVTIHDVPGNVVHWHLVAPAVNPTTIIVPAGILPPGNYAVDVAFVQEFLLTDTTIQATLTDDYSKLLRTLPKQLSAATTNITVN
jgi:hypothetical protein